LVKLVAVEPVVTYLFGFVSDWAATFTDHRASVYKQIAGSISVLGAARVRETIVAETMDTIVVFPLS
jgi:hypothetical protein